MSKAIVIFATALAAALAAGAQAYDPMPDPRLSPGATVPTPPPGSTDWTEFGDSLYGMELKGRHKPRGEPEFGTSSRSTNSVGGYGLGTRKAEP